MTTQEWRALIEGYLDARLSAEAFMRRFIEAWGAAKGALPPAIAALQPPVEAFEAAVAQAGEEGAVNDDELRQACQCALANLREQPSVSAHTFDRTRAREEMARFQISAQSVLGLGCLIGLVWIALCLLQINYVSVEIQTVLGWDPWPSAVMGFFLAFVPILGNVLAFLGATHQGWPDWLAAIAFFAAPAVTFFSGWSRWRRRGPRG